MTSGATERRSSGALVAIISSEAPLVAVLRAALDDRGYHPRTWSNTRDAIAVITRQRPALILLDIHVEKRNAGIALLRLLRADPATAGIPVLVWSADVRTLRAKRPELVALGACAIEAPFDLDTFDTCITSLLG